ncbi:Protein kinase domain-containing protein [Meloidogyne graminicola]|uniref:Protein kinase domain-containing protein n=1 Tax=Meloidogyne graminicola TaxID=189291 RepID=A0A8S9ZTA6_9BILA|nr:Protein kinase domain-containing protein [Meloidogyne graminicola]
MDEDPANNIHRDYKDPSGVSVTIFEDGAEQEPQLVALKKVIIPRIKDFRELHILRHVVRHSHPNIVRLMFSQRRKYKMDVAYTLVFEFIPTTLAKLKQVYSKERNVVDIKLCIWQLFAGLHHLKELNIIHRDIKPANLLVNPKTGRLIIADFGSAIFIPSYPDVYQGTYAVTRYYRPPELILGAKRYNCMVDVWSAGCIFAELYIGEALFAGTSAYVQLQLIYNKLGTPSADDLKDMQVLEKDYICAIKHQAIYPFGELFSVFEQLRYPEESNPASLLVKILDLNPEKRLFGRQLLSDNFFAELFQEGRRRNNGALVTDAISLEQRQHIIGTEVQTTN